MPINNFLDVYVFKMASNRHTKSATFQHHHWTAKLVNSPHLGHSHVPRLRNVSSISMQLFIKKLCNFFGVPKTGMHKICTGPAFFSSSLLLPRAARALKFYLNLQTCTSSIGSILTWSHNETAMFRLPNCSNISQLLKQAYKILKW